MRKKGKLTRIFDTSDIVVVRNQSKQIRKYGVSQNWYSKQRESIEFCRRLLQPHIDFSVCLFVRV